MAYITKNVSSYQNTSLISQNITASQKCSVILKLEKPSFIKFLTQSTSIIYLLLMSNVLDLTYLSTRPCQIVKNSVAAWFLTRRLKWIAKLNLHA